MSRNTIRRVTCPKCGAEKEVAIWESVNTSVDPSLKQMVLERRLTEFVCPSCGYTTPVIYGFLYHQPEDKVMISFVTSDDQVQGVINSFTTPPFNMFPGYKKRVVRSYEELTEKIRIFDSGLDDRVIEIEKLLLFPKIKAALPDAVGVYFSKKNDNSISFDVLSSDGLVRSVSTSGDMYGSILPQYKSRLENQSESFVVNSNYAKMTLAAV